MLTTSHKYKRQKPWVNLRTDSINEIERKVKEGNWTVWCCSSVSTTGFNIPRPEKYPSFIERPRVNQYRIRWNMWNTWNKGETLMAASNLKKAKKCCAHFFIDSNFSHYIYECIRTAKICHQSFRSLIAHHSGCPNAPDLNAFTFFESFNTSTSRLNHIM